MFSYLYIPVITRFVNREGCFDKQLFWKQIVDPETEVDLPANQNGEVRIIGKMVTLGYLNDEVATKGAFDENGYFKTGEIL